MLRIRIILVWPGSGSGSDLKSFLHFFLNQKYDTYSKLWSFLLFIKLIIHTYWLKWYNILIFLVVFFAKWIRPGSIFPFHDTDPDLDQAKWYGSGSTTLLQSKHQPGCTRTETTTWLDFDYIYMKYIMYRFRKKMANLTAKHLLLWYGDQNVIISTRPGGRPIAPFDEFFLSL